MRSVTMMEGPQMQQGHDFLRAPPAPPATAVPAPAPAEFGRSNVIFDGAPRSLEPIHSDSFVALMMLLIR